MIVIRYTAARIESVGYALIIEGTDGAPWDGPTYRVLVHPANGGAFPVLVNATWVQAMDWCRDRVRADIAAEMAS